MIGAWAALATQVVARRLGPARRATSMRAFDARLTALARTEAAPKSGATARLGPASPRPFPPDRPSGVHRRRRVLIAFFTAEVATLVLAMSLRSQLLWALHVVAAALLVTYVGLLVSRARRHRHKSSTAKSQARQQRRSVTTTTGVDGLRTMGTPWAAAGSTWP